MRLPAQHVSATTPATITSGWIGNITRTLTVAAARIVTPRQARRDGPSETRTAGGLCMPSFKRARVGDTIVRLDEAPRDRKKDREKLRRSVRRFRKCLFLAGEREPCLDHGIGIERNTLDTLFNEPLRKIRMVRGTLSANPAVNAALAARSDRHRQHHLHRGIAFVELRRNRPAGIAIEPQRQLRHVVRADREA